MPLNKNEIGMSARNVFIIIGVVVLFVLGAAAIIFSKNLDGNLISPGIAVIPLKGEISSATYDDFSKLFKEAEEDMTISAIIIEINSPGGSVLPSREIAAQIKASKKPVVALVQEVGASGAYWAASAADKIVADPLSMTGSIGVVGSYLQYAGLMEKYGVTYERLVSGKYKDAGSQYKDLTADERAYLQSKINFIQDIFVSEVSANRNMPVATVKKLATGEIFFGTEAQTAGLVDILGNKDTAQKEAEKLAGITTSHLVPFEKELTLADFFGAKINNFAYEIGLGIGDGITPVAEDSFDLRAEI